MEEDDSIILVEGLLSGSRMSVGPLRVDAKCQVNLLVGTLDVDV
jgi:hypothetical protein